MAHRSGRADPIIRRHSDGRCTDHRRALEDSGNAGKLRAVPAVRNATAQAVVAKSCSDRRCLRILSSKHRLNPQPIADIQTKLPI